jgi:hypothetical protein
MPRVISLLALCTVLACGERARSDSELDVRVAEPAGSRAPVDDAPMPPDASPVEATASEESPESANAGDAGASDCPPTEVISDVSEKATGPGAAVNIMVALCGRCHTPEGSERVPEGPSNVADFNRMIDEGFAVDCSADRSSIIQIMRADEMRPPAHPYAGPLSVVDIDVVARFIEFLCSDEEKACAVEPSAPGCGVIMSARRERRCAGWRTP